MGNEDGGLAALNSLNRLKTSNSGPGIQRRRWFVENEQLRSRACKPARSRFSAIPADRSIPLLNRLPMTWS